MDTKIDLEKFGDERLVYVRSVEAEDLPAELREQVGKAPEDRDMLAERMGQDEARVLFDEYAAAKKA